MRSFMVVTEERWLHPDNTSCRRDCLIKRHPESVKKTLSPGLAGGHFAGLPDNFYEGELYSLYF